MPVVWVLAHVRHHQRLRAAESKAFEAEIVVQLTADIRRRAGDRLGAGKVYAEARATLQDLGIECGRDRSYAVPRAHDLLIRPKERHVRTTDSSAWMRQFPDLRTELTPAGPEELWVADITYVACAEARCYLSLVTDAYSRRIMG